MDMGSSNGTWVNGQRLVRPFPLENGSVIEVGMVKMTFRIAGVGGAPTAPMESALLPCWFVSGEASTLGFRLPAEGDFEKTFEGWTERCVRIVKACQGVSMRSPEDGFLAFWQEEAGTDKSANVVKALLALRSLQGSTEELRFAVHYSEVEMRVSASGEVRPVGAEVIHVFQLQKLIRTIGVNIVLSDAAAINLRESLPIRPLTTQELRGHRGNGQFHTLRNDGHSGRTA